MSVKAHMSNGVWKKCEAKTRPCPLGGDELHKTFKSLDEMKEHNQKLIDEQGAKEHGLAPTISSKPNKKETRQDKVNRCFKQIEDGVRNVFTTDNYKNYLDFVSKFHSYSNNNIMLIHAQNPNATAVAGFKKWKNEFNRVVNKGEKGIMILAPATYKKKSERKKLVGGKVVKDKDGNPVKEEVETKGMYYRPVYVFDVAQTSGEPLPKLMDDLEGTSKEAKALIKSVQEISDYEFSFVATSDDDILWGGAKGYCDTKNKKIVINNDLSDIQQAKTAIHELAHAELHENSTASREQKEIEAESVAYTLSNHFGLDTSDYSFPYIASWAGKDHEELSSVLSGIRDRTTNIIGRIDPVFAENLDN